MGMGFLVHCIICVVMIGVQMKGYEGCLEMERRGLLEIKAFFVSRGGEAKLASWVDDKASNCCLWDRVTCNNSTNHVTELDLSILSNSESMLNISLFRPFGELLRLDLSWNFIDGWIDNGEGFQTLKKLETLVLSANYLRSSTLSCLSTLTSLRTLKLDYNLIDSSLIAQPDFANFSGLKILDLSYNQLNGSLGVTGFTNFSNLEILDLSHNQLNGSLDATGLCKLRNLAELGLGENMLSGQISKCIGNLTNLQVLDLSLNFFTGNFPSFSNVTSLRYLYLVESHLEGFFPFSSLANLSKLEIVQLSTKSINGLQVEIENPQWVPTFQLKTLMLRRCNLNVIPNFLLHQYDLESLDLSHNKIVNSFPSWLLQNNSRLDWVVLRNNSLFGNFELSSIVQSIHLLDVSNNNMSGQLPINFGLLLPALSSLNLSINNFESTIPSSLCELKSLSILDLSYNHFYGHLPKNLTMGCIQLLFLKLSNNFLQGQFMPKSSKLDTLQWLYLSNNKFNGTMDGLVKNKELIVVDITNNSISGRIPNSINELSSLEVLLMSKNQLQGKIPSRLSDIQNLTVLDLSHNNLSGSIPYLNLSSLRSLYMQNNSLKGSIPPALSGSSMLTILNLKDNKLSGNIPQWINKLHKLRFLLLGRNRLKGRIPVELCQVQNISLMDLSCNKLYGPIPSCLQNMSFGMVKDDDNGTNFGRLNVGMLFYLQQREDIPTDTNISLNHFLPIIRGELIQIEVAFRTKGNFYSYKGNILEYMSGLDLSSNELNGEIPIQIGNLQQIHALNLSHNNFSGSIPKSFSNLTQIESLDLSFNNLSGEIPSQLSQLNFLAVFNVSYNNLSGTTLSSGQFANFDEDNYKGNPSLCGPLLKKRCYRTNVVSFPAPSVHGRENETWIDLVAFYWSFVGSFITTVLALVIILFINAQWRRAWFRFIEKCLYSWFPLY